MDNRTPLLNRIWWEHLAPKAMIPLLGEAQALLNEFARTDYGRLWLDAAQKELGMFRVKPGQAIPTLHMVFLNKRRMILPPETLKAGHRTVGGMPLEGGPLNDGELSMQPQISVDLVTDPAMNNLAEKGQTPRHVIGVTQPSQVLTVPAHFLLSPKTWPKKSYVLYQHIFGEGGSYPNDGYFYVGVTTRTWRKRWAEHLWSMEAGSPLLFHKKLREEIKEGRVTYINHKVMGITDDVEQLYDAEERIVAGHWHDKRRLNMIPGGKSGLKYMREHGMLSERVVPMPDERDRMLAEWIQANPRKGLPAPWVAEKWKDNDWAVAQICGRDGRLSVEQVRAIRHLAEIYSAEIIADRIGAKNVEQVQRVLDGKTYTRVT